MLGPVPRFGHAFGVGDLPSVGSVFLIGARKHLDEDSRRLFAIAIEAARHRQA